MNANSRLYGSLAKLCAEQDGTISFYTKDGLKVIWGRYVNPEMNTKLKYLNDVMFDGASRFSGLEYIDLMLASENRVIVKPVKTIKKSDKQPVTGDKLKKRKTQKKVTYHLSLVTDYL